jgi:uncharacterized membrane protein SpoIIM required for sporulation
MDLATFLERRRPQWRQLEAVLRRIEGSGLATLDEEQAVEFGRLYRSAASDLNQAQTFVSGDATVQYLNDLVARCYVVIYTKSRIDLWGLVRYLLWGYPAVFRRYLGHVLLATALLAAGAVFGFLVSYYDPQTARAFLLPRNFPTIQPGQEGSAHSVGELAGFSAFLFRHNMSVSLVAFALGITFGIGTAWFMFENGILMGVLGAVFYEAGEFTAFCTGILPHGVLEIPAILIGGGAGFLLAQGLIRARPWPRLEELARIGREAIWLVGGCVPLLIGAGFVEAVIARAPDRYLDSGLKLAVACVLGLAFFAYVFLVGWRKPAPSA